jgi:hypothetical protein
MHRLVCYFVCSAGLAGFAWAGLASTSRGQSPAPMASTALPSTGLYRKLVPGVMQKVDPQRELEETFDSHDLVELLAVDKTFDWAKDVTFRRDIWFLNFEFKPVRYIEVDIPQADGHMQRKLIRYLVYNVTNPGRIMHPEPDQDGTVRVMPVNKPIKFIPQFSLEQDDAQTLRSQIGLYRANHLNTYPTITDNALPQLTSTTDVNGNIGTGAAFIYGPYLDRIPVNPFNSLATVGPVPTPGMPPATGDGKYGYEYDVTTGNIFPDHTGWTYRVYPDHVMPLAMVAIRQREDPNRVFWNTVEMTREIAVGQTCWGIATWEDIDPKITHFWIFVNGLTNAYRFTDDAGAYKAGDPIGKGRHLTRKTLKLNFWKPGDPFLEHEEEVRYGVPGDVDYEWLYR